MTSRPLKDHEVDLILSHMTSLRDQTLFILSVKTGFRISELLSLTVSQIVGDNCDVITVARSSMKGKQRSRSVPLHSVAKEYLNEYISRNFTSRDAILRLFPITRVQAWRIIKNAARKAGLSGCISTHSGRKTFGMNVYTRTNNNLKAAQMALGHVSIQSTGHYLSVGRDEVDAAILA